jgi:ABC-2 type transport system permease protein
MKLYMRQNRIFTLIWLLVPGLWIAINTLSSLTLFPTQAALEEMAVTLVDPLTVAMHGPLLDISVAGFVTWRTKVFAVLLCGIFSTVYMVRHTRLAEERGQRELLGANAIGSLAPLAATYGNMLLINCGMTVLALLGMTATGLGFWGSLAHCLAIFASSCFIGSISGVAAQLFVGASAARGASLGCFALLFVLHVFLNMQGGFSPVAYLSPLEWPLLVRPFAGERFAVLLIPSVMTALFAGLSLLLMSRRDLGAGLFPHRKGHAYAKPGFRSLGSLAWRTQKGLFLSWLLFYAVFSFGLGYASYLMVGAVSSAEALAGLIERLGGVDRAFMSLMLYMFSMVIAVYPLMSAGILRREESAKGEMILSLPIKRTRFAAGHLFYIFGGSGTIALVSGLCAGLGAAIGTGEQGALLQLFLEVAEKLPAIWLMGGIAVFLYGALPRWMNGMSYGLLVLFVMLEVLWEQQSVSDAIYAISPFSWVTPLKVVQPPALVAVCIVAALFAAVGVALFRRRDAVLGS